jgi:hypothetical protein
MYWPFPPLTMPRASREVQPVLHMNTKPPLSPGPPAGRPLTWCACTPRWGTPLLPVHV